MTLFTLFNKTPSAKQRELITMLADSEKEMHEWINLLTAVAGKLTFFT